MSRQDRMTPVDGALYVVRWVRLDGRDVRHRYYRRLIDAKGFQAKLDGVERDARIYLTTTKWQKVAS